jgi:hypothetical protein
MTRSDCCVFTMCSLLSSSNGTASCEKKTMDGLTAPGVAASRTRQQVVAYTASFSRILETQSSSARTIACMQRISCHAMPFRDSVNINMLIPSSMKSAPPTVQQKNKSILLFIHMILLSASYRSSCVVFLLGLVFLQI